MAGTTGLEPAASAVTGCVSRFYNNLQDTRGLPNAAQVIQDHSNCGLECGLRNSSLEHYPPQLFPESPSLNTAYRIDQMFDFGLQLRGFNVSLLRAMNMGKRSQVVVDEPEMCQQYYSDASNRRFNDVRRLGTGVADCPVYSCARRRTP